MDPNQLQQELKKGGQFKGSTYPDHQVDTSMGGDCSASASASDG